MIDADVMLDASLSYSVVAMGLVSNNTLAPYVFTDDLNGGGQAKLRYIHGSLTAPAVDVRLRNGGVLFGNTSFGQAAAGIEVGEGTYDFDVNVAGTAQTALLIDGVPLNNGTNYSVFATGLLGDKRGSDLH